MEAWVGGEGGGWDVGRGPAGAMEMAPDGGIVVVSGRSVGVAGAVASVEGGEGDGQGRSGRDWEGPGRG